jgi:glutaminyl-peptide cyclotransferase
VAAYNGNILRSRNLIGAINPSAKKRILLCAHWDSRHVADHDKDSANWQKPILGANDGGSGVGVLLEVARLMAPDSAKLGFGVDIIFFDSEDHGQPEFDRSVNNPDSWCLGAKHWAQNKHVPGYQGFYGILLDMVGAPNAKFYQEGVSLEYAPSIVQKVWNIGHQLGYGAFFIRESTDPIIDDHRYINEMAGIPTIDIVQYHSASGGFHPSWHTQGDNMDVIDRATLKAVGQTVLQTLYNEIAPAQPLN